MSCTDGWIDILRRIDGSQNFNRTWADYVNGFGDPHGEFWLGLETLHSLTSSGTWKLRADMAAWNGDQFYEEFNGFSVGDASGSYVLAVGDKNPQSTANADGKNSMEKHNGMKFSTLDKDNDMFHKSCAEIHTGGWWYNACHSCHPTGTYFLNGTFDSNGVTWLAAYGGGKKYYSFKQMELRIKQF